VDGSFACCTPGTINLPTISTQPTGQVAVAGATVSFNVSGAGTLPMAYQWHLDGTNLTGATVTPLVLIDVQPAQAGSYSVVLTNVAGSVTSAVATLKVLVPPEVGGITVNGTGVGVSLGSVAGLSYRLEYKDSLSDPTWTPLPPTVLGTGGPLVLQDTNAIAPSRFYRVLCE